MPQNFIEILSTLPFVNDSIAEIRNRALTTTSREQFPILLEEIKFRIDACLETQNMEEKNYYYLLRAYCYLMTNDPEKAVISTTYSIDGFRIGGHSWAEIVGHWFLGAIYESQRKGYLFLAEIKHAIEILEPIRQDHLIKGEYAQANDCARLKSVLEAKRDAAQKMGTGPLHMPAPPNPDPDPNPPPATNAAGSLLLPWLPKYHKVKAGLDEVMWDDPIKPRATFAQTLEIDGHEFRIFPLTGKNSHERQITLITQEHYGWAMVDGNSMNASRPIPICHGDYILFRLRNQPQNDDVVVASRPTASGGFAHMVKRFRDAERDLASETEDTSAEYPPMPLGPRHQILGIVIAVAKPI